MNKSIALIVFCLSSVFSTLGMTVEELFAKMKATSQETSQYGFDVKYSLFKTYSSQQVHSSYNGYLYQEGAQVYQKIKQTEFVNTKEFSLKINHEQKLIQVDPAQPAQALNFNPQEALKLCARKSIVVEGDSYLVTLEYTASSISPFAKVEMKVSKKTFFMSKLEFYYKAEQDFAAFGEKPDRSKPRLVMTISNVDKAKENSDLLTTSKYVVKEKNKVIPASRLAGYKIVDNRIN